MHEEMVQDACILYSCAYVHLCETSNSTDDPCSLCWAISLTSTFSCAFGYIINNEDLPLFITHLKYQGQHRLSILLGAYQPTLG